MDDATPTGAGPLRVVRIVFRIVFSIALVVLLVLIGIKQAPAVLAAMARATPTTTSAAGASTGQPTATAPTSATPIPTLSVPSVTIPPVSRGGGGTGGGGTGGGGGTTTSSKPASTAPVVTSLHAADVACPTRPSDAPGATSVPNPVVTVSWSSTGGTKAWFGVHTSDAEAAPYSQVETTGNISLDFPCSTASQLYTITVVGAGGKASRSITVRNTGAVG